MPALTNGCGNAPQGVSRGMETGTAGDRAVVVAGLSGQRSWKAISEEF